MYLNKSTKFFYKFEFSFYYVSITHNRCSDDCFVCHFDRIAIM